MAPSAEAAWIMGISGIMLVSSMSAVLIMDNKKKISHLTYWAIFAHAAYFAASIFSIFRRSTKIIELLHTPCSQLAWFIAGAMTSLSIQDDLIVIESEEDAPPFLVGIGNFVLHYMPPLIYTHLACSHPQTYVHPYINTHDTFMLSIPYIVLPTLFTVTYSNAFDPHDEYAGDFLTTFIYLGGGIGILIGMAFGAATYHIQNRRDNATGIK
jgi:hypothetical protein